MTFKTGHNLNYVFIPSPVISTDLVIEKNCP